MALQGLPMTEFPENILTTLSQKQCADLAGNMFRTWKRGKTKSIGCIGYINSITASKPKHIAKRKGIGPFRLRFAVPCVMAVVMSALSTLRFETYSEEEELDAVASSMQKWCKS